MRNARELKREFILLLDQLVRSREFRKRLLFFADSGNSFESWLNWELAWVFAKNHPWPRYSVARESRLDGGGLADLVLAVGSEYQPGVPACYVETKLIWANANRGKMVRFAVDDFRRLRGLKDGVMVVVAVSAAQESQLNVEPADVTLTEFEKALERAGIVESRNIFDCHLEASNRGEWYLRPRIHIRAYQAGV
ncbi:hypothetical protein [Corallococcus sicarius]|uniref:hypothetical protein n=1 Tax=Corallococcus sicarius TaxID=2316726 RepID=UPI0011C38CA6|nr:hypothetical protein [Corallococcus sicarius]